MSDFGSGNLVVLDAETLAPVDAFGGNLVSGTHDVDIGPDGRVYVADKRNGRVAIFSMQGTRGRLSGGLRGRVAVPEGVPMQTSGLVHLAGARSNNVIAYRDTTVVYEFSGLSGPHDLELAGDGGICLADAGNDRILLLSEVPVVVGELRGPPFHFDGVRYLGVLPDGTLSAADKYSHSIKPIDAAGRLLATLGTGQPARGVDVSRSREGVDTAGDLVWIADSGDDRIVRYRCER